MDIFSALNVGVTGVLAQSGAINTISQNISNADTVGYKEGMTTFAELISDNTANNFSVNGNGSADAGFAPSGVMASDTQLNDVQGNITSTNSPTDIAISGNGFFAVSPTATNSTSNLEYTRAGSFVPDANGNYANVAGDFLQAWPLNADGTLPASLSGASVDSSTATAALQTVNIQKIVSVPVPTTIASLQANLNASQATYAGAYDPNNPATNMASGAVTPDFVVPVTVVDSAGATHNLDAGFLKTGTNTWAVEVYAQPAADVTAASGQVAAGTVTFNGDGTLASISPSLTQIPITWTAAGTAASSIAFNWGTAGAIGTGEANGLSQFDEANSVLSIHQNGIQANTATTASISPDGVISVTYSNGGTRNLYQIPLAQFTNPEQLQTLSDNVFTPTVGSGTLTFSQPAQGTASVIAPNALESSNVDLATQLTNMIVAQNAYQANTKLISASDEMMQNLVQMDQSISV